MTDTCPHCGRLYQERRPVVHGLTRRQSNLLAIITAYIEVEGIPPSYAEMASVMGLKSKSGIYRLVHGLAERGHLSFKKDRARSIVLTNKVGANEYRSRDPREVLSPGKADREGISEAVGTEDAEDHDPTPDSRSPGPAESGGPISVCAAAPDAH